VQKYDYMFMLTCRFSLRTDHLLADIVDRFKAGMSQLGYQDSSKFQT
jgi:hypothetical protein